jgi:ATP-dependent protease ClpP protease subunit
MERDKFMSADEAVTFGLIDHVVEKRPTNFAADHKKDK